jgi:hypothetical protein
MIKMKKKLATISILAAFALLMITLTTVADTQITQRNYNKYSPLYKIRTYNVLNIDIGSKLFNKFSNERIFRLPFKIYIIKNFFNFEDNGFTTAATCYCTDLCKISNNC